MRQNSRFTQLVRSVVPHALLSIFLTGKRDNDDGGTVVSRQELTTPWLRQHIDTYDEVVEVFRKGDLSFSAPEQYGKQLAKLGTAGIDKAMNNGLDGDDNRQLFCSLDANRIFDLLLQGMRKIF